MLLLTPPKKNQQVAQIAETRLLIDALLLVELLVLFLLSTNTTKNNHVTAFVDRHHHHHHHHNMINSRGSKLLTSSLLSSSIFFADARIDSHPTRGKIRSGRRIGGRCNKRNQKRNVKNGIQYKNKNRIDGDGIKTEINNNKCTMVFRIDDIFNQPCTLWKDEPFFYDSKYFDTGIVHDQYGRPWKLKVVFRQQQKNLIQRILTFGVINPNDGRVVKNNNEEGVAFIVQFVGSSSEKNGVGVKSISMSVPRKNDSFWYDRGYTDIPSSSSLSLYPFFFGEPDNYLDCILYLPKDVVQLSRSDDGKGSLIDVEFQFEFEDPRWVRFRNTVFVSRSHLTGILDELSLVFVLITSSFLLEQLCHTLSVLSMRG